MDFLAIRFLVKNRKLILAIDEPIVHWLLNGEKLDGNDKTPAVNRVQLNQLG
jgi:hypothetical protein